MNELVGKLRSVRLKNERPIWVRPPINSSRASWVTIFLDGEIYRDRVGAVAVIDALQGSMADSWFVFVSMESPEARWLECPCYRPFAEFIVEELLPWLATQYAEMGAVRQKTIVGLSYTGLAAAFIAMEFPGVFQKVISQSGSFWWNESWLVGQCRKQADVLPGEFYLDVGTREVQENVRHRADVLQVVSQIGGVRGFRDALLGRGCSVCYVEFEDGHEIDAWRRALPAALVWALPKETKLG